MVVEYIYNQAGGYTAPPQGNRLQEIRKGLPTGGVVAQFHYDDAGRVLSKVDSAGNLLYLLSYDGKGQAGFVAIPSHFTVMKYDVQGNRIQKSSTLYFMDGKNLEATYNASGTLQDKYFRGVVVDEIVNGYHYNSSNPNDWINYTFHHDQLNSVTALSGPSGNIKETTRYDTFGKPLSLALPGTGNDLLYTGREYDRNTGLYYYRARYYDPEIGRFVSEDPMGFKAGVNFYTYVNNNPVNANDPMGNVKSWPALLRQGVGVVGSGLGIGAGIVVTGTGIVGVAVPEPATTLGGLGLIAVGTATFATSVDDLDKNMNAMLNNIFETNVSRSTSLRSDLLKLSGFSVNNPIAGGAYDAVDLGLSIPSGRIAGNLLNLPTALSKIGDVNTILNTSQSIFNSSVRIIDSIGSSSASGGFVLYPNKANTNMMQSVYSK